MTAADTFPDAVAFARAVSAGDLDGAFEVWKDRGPAAKMRLAFGLAHSLALIVGGDDDLWLMLAEIQPERAL